MLTFFKFAQFTYFSILPIYFSILHNLTLIRVFFLYQPNISTKIPFSLSFVGIFMFYLHLKISLLLILEASKGFYLSSHQVHLAYNPSPTNSLACCAFWCIHLLPLLLHLLINYLHNGACIPCASTPLFGCDFEFFSFLV